MNVFHDDALCRQSARHVPGWEGTEPRMERLAKGGSDRWYYRLTRGPGGDGPESVVLMVYTDQRPDSPSFFPATEILQAAGVNVPQVYHHDPERRIAWLEDLGAEDLGDRLAREPGNLDYYRAALRQAARIHRLRPQDVDASRFAALQPPFDGALYQWEQDYFFDEFARRFSCLPTGEQEHLRNRPALAGLRDTLARLPRFLVHRDLQSQNVIVRGSDSWLIDYQGLRPGRPEYDLASLLYDPYVQLSPEARKELLDEYLELRREEDGWESDPMILAMCACQRLMQALGAYAKLGVGMGRTEYLQWIPPAVDRLRQLLQDANLLPELLPLLEYRREMLAGADKSAPAA